MKRLVVVAAGACAVGLAVLFVRYCSGLPPPEFVLKYGFQPECSPTGRVRSLKGIDFVEISAGCSMMGVTTRQGWDVLGRVGASLGLNIGKQPRVSANSPAHWVEFPSGFWIARTETTVALYREFCRDYRPLYWATDADPVVLVSWHEARAFCDWLAMESGLPTRLPSESEWECAARAGDRLQAWDDRGASDLILMAHCKESVEAPRRGPMQCATRRPNAWGLYDLHGNVEEWCEDSLHDNYIGAPVAGEAWTDGGAAWASETLRIVRGGTWLTPAKYILNQRSRHGRPPTERNVAVGFRVAFSLAGE